MFVQPAYRGLHLGEQLMNTVLVTARELGYHCMKLDSLRRLEPAVKLYLRYGFEEIAPYNYNPEPDVVYFEKNLLH
jgi:ribosomal protein S18 acetylase RimI-like enzyme